MKYLHKGPKPFVIILCKFPDVGIPSDWPRESFYDFVAPSGKGGLFDYWKDVSFGNIDLTGSEVFGWYTMPNSFVDKGGSNRVFWFHQARQLAAAHGVDLSRFYGVISVINMYGDGSAEGGYQDMAMSVQGVWGENDWRYCAKCHGIYHGSTSQSLSCPGGGTHDFSPSYNYMQALNLPTFPGQPGWKQCGKCKSLWYAGGPGLGHCQAGGTHDGTASGYYSVGFGAVNYYGQNYWKACTKCLCLSYCDFDKPDNSGSIHPGPCPAGGTHDFTGTFIYSLVADFGGSGISPTFCAHETGHCLGLSHSWRGGSGGDVEYGDAWDIMSAFNVMDFQSGYFNTSGPGLNGATLHKLGWIPDARIKTIAPSSSAQTAQINLAPLDVQELDGFLLARMTSPTHVYSFEFRRSEGWDRGIGLPVVLMHEQRSNYTTGQQGWRYCFKCEGLAYAGQSFCPAGGVHDHLESFNYALSMNETSYQGQDGWRYCKKCQGLSWSGDPGKCAAGGQHDYSSSGSYKVARVGHATDDPTTEAQGQKGWRWCCKCSGLSYAGSQALGNCPVGGVHDHSGSEEYVLLHDTSDATKQSGWKWCRKCQGLAFDGFDHCTAGGAHLFSQRQDGIAISQSSDYSLSLNDATMPGQSGWHWCRKCYGLVHGPGVCKAGGSHDFSAMDTYVLVHDDAAFDGQDHWKHCHKCELLATDISRVGPCPAGGNHDHSLSLNYKLANFDADRTYLLLPTLTDGSSFSDPARNVYVKVGWTDPETGATITLSNRPI